MSWRLITHNFGWKLGSLVMAVLLWFAIVGEPELVTTRSVPILYKNLPDGLLIGPDAPNQVRVELRGPSSKLTSTSVSDLAVLLDLFSITSPGERTFTLSDSDLRVPQGVTFLRAVPSQLRLRFARLRSKEVPVQIQISGIPSSGYRIVRQEVTPDTLRIAGPEARVEAISSALTDAIDLSGLSQTFESRVNTLVNDPEVRLESSPIVTVRVTIEKTGKL